MVERRKGREARHLRGAAGVWFLCAGLNVAAAPAVGAEEMDASLQVRIGRRADAAAVRHAVEGAFRRLGEPGCRRVFSDFKDAAGHTLQDDLDGLGQTAQGYLGWVFFYDGFAESRCLKTSIQAFTSRGSRVVHICTAQFTHTQLTEPATAEAIVIHEALHSLGLGENPPVSAEITRRVLTRCMSGAPAMKPTPDAAQQRRGSGAAMVQGQPAREGE